MGITQTTENKVECLKKSLDLLGHLIYNVDELKCELEKQFDQLPPEQKKNCEGEKIESQIEELREIYCSLENSEDSLLEIIDELCPNDNSF